MKKAKCPVCNKKYTFRSRYVPSHSQACSVACYNQEVVEFKKIQLFVYGTLKSTEVNYHMLKNEEFVGYAKTEPKYRLIDLGVFPGLVEDDDGLEIEGEIYRVGWYAFQMIDYMESGLYVRKEIAIKEVKTAKIVGPIYGYILREGARYFQGIEYQGTCWTGKKYDEWLHTD